LVLIPKLKIKIYYEFESEHVKMWFCQQQKNTFQFDVKNVNKQYIRGIVKNLLKDFPFEKSEKLVLIGGAFIRNPLFKKAVQMFVFTLLFINIFSFFIKNIKCKK